jgi:hypothetical protein
MWMDGDYAVENLLKNSSPPISPVTASTRTFMSPEFFRSWKIDVGHGERLGPFSFQWMWGRGLRRLPKV